MLAMTGKTLESNNAFGSDQLVYNLEFLQFRRLVMKILVEFHPTSNDMIFTYPSSFWSRGLFTDIDKTTYKISFQPTNTFQLHFLDIPDFKKNYSWPNNAYYWCFINCDTLDIIKNFKSIYQHSSFNLYDVDGYQMSSYHLWQPYKKLINMRSTDQEIQIVLEISDVLKSDGAEVALQDNMVTWGPYWNNNAQLLIDPTRFNARTDFLLNFKNSITGHLSLHFTTANDYGMVEVLINNKPLSPELIDLYSPTVNFKVIKFNNVSFLKGNNILSLQMINKNTASKGIRAGIDTITVGL
jgi:hypothetical protein